MTINYEINDIIMLANEAIVFKSESNEKSFKLYQPTVRDIYTNDSLMFLITFLEKDQDEINKWINIDVKSHYDFIHYTCSLADINEDFKKLSNDFLEGLKFFIPNIRFDKTLKIGNNIVVTSNLFNKIIKVIFKTLDKDKIIIEDDDDEITKKMKQNKLKIQRIKRNSKDNKEGTGLNDIIAAILYEFPQYKISDVLDMNLFTLYYLFKYVGKIANYEVNKIAFGNGLVKKGQKIKYFID